MNFELEFEELDQSFDMEFEELHDISDGGYERGYADGVASVPDYLDALMNDELITYSNQRATSIKAYFFSGVTSLEEASFPSVISVGDRAFYNCSGLKKIDLPLAESIGAYCFQSTKIVEANFPNVKTTPTSAFFSCGSITTALFPKSSNVGPSMFRGCSKLKNIDFSSAETIGDTAFYTNTALEYADFPKAQRIGVTAFIACKNLKTLILRNPEGVCTLANVNALDQTPIKNGTGYVYVPDSLVDQYKAAANWSTFASQIKPISELPE